MESQERAYSTKEVSHTLGIGDSTLRKWCLALEKNGYTFIKNEREQRLFIESDLVCLRHFQTLVQQHNMQLENVAIVVIDRFGKGAFEEGTGPRLIRLIVKDDELKYSTVVKLVEKVDNNEVTLIISTIVIAECCWLLKSFFKLEKQLVTEYLIDIIESENVELEEDNVIDVLRLYSEKNVDFADALLCVK